MLGALASGWSTTEIAEHLSIAPTTVKSYACRIRAKIGAHSRVQAVAFAYESGLIAPHTTRSALPRPTALAPTPQPRPWTARPCRSREEDELSYPSTSRRRDIPSRGAVASVESAPSL